MSEIDNQKSIETRDGDSGAESTEISRAFRTLDGESLERIRVEYGRGEGRVASERLTLALAWIRGGDAFTGREILFEIENDAELSRGDLAFVHAFAYHVEGNAEAMLAALLPALDDETATHPNRLKLRAADALLKLRRFDEIDEVLAPVLAPPGNAHTLEAFFVMLHAETASTKDRDRLIEMSAMIDGLIEKDFRLLDPYTAAFYARLAQQEGIEGIVEPILRAHEEMIEHATWEDDGTIEFFVAAGDKGKVPGVLRAAARAYAARPFAFESEIDPERAAYLFASHDEYEAARQVFLLNFTPAQIHGNGNLWGPLLYTTHHAQLFAEALEIMNRHAEEIATMDIRDDVEKMRHICEVHVHGKSSVENLD